MLKIKRKTFLNLGMVKKTSKSHIIEKRKFQVLREDPMKKIMLALSVLFIVLTFVGAGYVLYNAGSVNAGYAVIPMALAFACITFYRKAKQQS